MKQADRVSIEVGEVLQQDGIRVERFEASLLPDRYIGQLIAKSRQAHILEHEGHEDVGTAESPGRFRDRNAFSNWAAKGRIVYLMLRDMDDTYTDVGGVIWFGQRANDVKPDYDLTFAIRHYTTYDKDSYGSDPDLLQFDDSDVRRDLWGQYLGKSYGTPFMQATHKDVTSNVYPDRGVWLSVVDGNDRAVALYTKVGYHEIDRIDDPDVAGRTRIVMAYKG